MPRPSKTKTPPSISMEEWFAKATAEERDAMSAVQLDYEFEGDNLGSNWWLFLQTLNFKHVNRKYELPPSAPEAAKGNTYTANEIYEELDRFVIPQLSSPYQAFLNSEKRKAQKTVEEDWWRNVRDELIFKKFHTEVKGFRLRQLSGTSLVESARRIQTAFPSPETGKTVGLKRQLTNDAGAEIFMRKGKRGRQSKHQKEALSHYNLYTDNTSATIVFPTMEEYAEAITTSFDMSQVQKKEDQLAALSFDQWKYLSVMNHSLLLYGIGSKRALLNRYAKNLEDDGGLMVIDGFHKDITISDILDMMVTDWLGGQRPGYNRHDVHFGQQGGMTGLFGSDFFYPVGEPSIVQKAIGIAKALSRLTDRSKRSFHLILHSIDGVGLRNPTAQEALAALVCYSKTSRGLNAFRLIASVDHINGPALLWDSLTSARFRWIWKQVHTHRPYVEELTESNINDRVSSKASQRKQDMVGSAERMAIFAVLSSLAPRHTEALQQLAGLQANQLALGDDVWVPYKSLWKQCQHKCIVSGDQQLRTFLKELSDHGVVEQSNQMVEILSYRIPHGAETLRQILDFSR